MKNTKIITLTLNPAVDHILSVETLSVYSKNMITDMHVFYGGKGVNVAYALGKLHTECTAAGFLGTREIQAFKEKLSKENVNVEFVPIDGPTRSNFKVMDNSAGKDTEFNQMGFFVKNDNLSNLISTLDKLLVGTAWLAISGSLPRGVPTDIYKEIILRAKKQNVKTCLDSSGPALQAGAAAKPSLLRINRTELEEIYGQSLGSISNTVAAIKELTLSGIDMAVISMGAQGVLANDGSSTFLIEVQKVTPKSLTGAGDTLTAGFLHALTLGKTFRDALLFSSALATASTLKLEPGNFSTEELDQMLKKVSIKKL